MQFKISLSGLLCLLVSFAAIAEETPQQPKTDANIFGHVIDAKTGEHLPFVNLIIKGTRIGTMTDASGHYLLSNLPEGEHVITA
ncbi:carboxypeptidase-like regulatory domain-containing protein, partial [Arthrospira platensis SPKY1]|nr:carboxypeptidase-like regulatory domain-containing protein [Arthrospira platensis SPKY1]